MVLKSTTLAWHFTQVWQFSASKQGSLYGPSIQISQSESMHFDILWCFLRMALLQRKVPKIVAVFGTNRELAEASSCYVKADHEWCGRNIWWFSIYLISFESLRKQIARTLTFAMATSYGCPWRTRPVLLQLHILNSFTCWIESLPISNLRTKKNQSRTKAGFKWLAGQVWLCRGKPWGVSHLQPGQACGTEPQSCNHNQSHLYRFFLDRVYYFFLIQFWNVLDV